MVLLIQTTNQSHLIWLNWFSDFITMFIFHFPLPFSLIQPLHEQVKNLLADIEQEQDDVAGKIAEMDGSPSSPPAIGNESSIYHSLATPGASMLALVSGQIILRVG